ncbi:hypothetical protein [Pedobacter mendelii]|uniref:Outer membrane protein beta-barrel domain-containing protein n=1 Tax=Pedobacter mendelii TaxID=1908240 RepID=A0ABQ2BEF0_9SPHI|nr:hypothetical protein [Pedobacter mendelii]GGI24056.1 hypothetical protein GCM10008119_10750 [Pedobacter mendelii]
MKVGSKAGVSLPVMSSSSDAQVYYSPPEYDFKTNTSFYLGSTVDFSRFSNIFYPGWLNINWERWEGGFSDSKLTNQVFSVGVGFALYN